jgi:hypothetical protein
LKIVVSPASSHSNTSPVAHHAKRRKAARLRTRAQSEGSMLTHHQETESPEVEVEGSSKSGQSAPQFGVLAICFTPLFTSSSFALSRYSVALVVSSREQGHVDAGCDLHLHLACARRPVHSRLHPRQTLRRVGTIDLQCVLSHDGAHLLCSVVEPARHHGRLPSSLVAQCLQGVNWPAHLPRDHRPVQFSRFGAMVGAEASIASSVRRHNRIQHLTHRSGKCACTLMLSCFVA